MTQEKGGPVDNSVDVALPKKALGPLDDRDFDAQMRAAREGLDRYRNALRELAS